MNRITYQRINDIPPPPPTPTNIPPIEDDISNYTDTELFQFLDLNNPTDRELEAKLYSLIDKYNSIKGTIGKQLQNFYISIFNHFFETEQENENDEEDNEYDEYNENYSLLHEKEGFETANTAAKPTTPANNATPAKPQEKESFAYTKNIDYTKGSLNPILRETIKRVVSIDSQFRKEKTYPYSTDFTFNLTEQLKDVVSLKLYSVNIPYNWYSINQNYGSNFIYIKGVSNGIDNGNFNYKISIDYGNYTASTIVNAVNDSIKTNLIKTNPDILFGKTEISYNSINGLCSITLDITNNYNETNYYLYFPYITRRPSASDTSTQNVPIRSIPELFGYVNERYYPFSIYSNIFVPKSDAVNIYTNTYINTNLYNVTETNKTIKIIIYDATNINNVISSYNSTSTILYTIPITLSLPVTTPQYGTAIFNDLNTQLANSDKLIQSYELNNTHVSSMINLIDASYSTAGGYKFSLNIRPNRKISNKPNQKMRVEFPDETGIEFPIWTDPHSLFNFTDISMEFQNEYSEKNNYITSYIVKSSPSIVLKCTAIGYGIFPTSFGNIPIDDRNDLSFNDYVINVPNSPNEGYTLTEYYKVIQAGFDNLKTSSNGKVIASIENNNSNSNTDINISINNTITTENFYLDLSSNFLHTNLGFPETIYGNVGSVSVNTPYQQSFTILTSANTFYIHSLNDISNISVLNNKYMNVSPVSIDTGNDGSIITNYDKLIINLNNVFNNYSQNNINLSNMLIYYEIVGGNTVKFTLNVNIQATLNNNDYTLYFFDESSIVEDPDNYDMNISHYYAYHYPEYGADAADLMLYYWYNSSNTSYDSSNSWYHNFGFQNPFYSLAITNPNSTTTTITGDIQNNTNLLQIDESNNYFQLIPIYNPLGGVYNTKLNATSATNNVVTYTIDLPINVSYTKEQIRDSINRAFNQAGSIAVGSYVDTSNPKTKIRLNINKIFSSKDYSLLFYDVNDFTQCNYGPNSSAQTTTADTTLAWKLGFRNNVIYYLTPENLITNIYNENTYYGTGNANYYKYDLETGVATLTGDTSVNLNIYNYFYIILDDYTQNHLNDGLITTINPDLDIPLPSYASKSSLKCVVSNDQVAVSDTKSNNNFNRLTTAQLYSANQILNNKNTKYTDNTLSSGPYIQDIFGIIPVKTAGLTYGQVYAEFGGTLQIQERIYFGPVNINRMTIRLITDTGNILDLNNQNWSFSLIAEQLYNPNNG